jgi:hypothetical protein
MIGSRAAFLSDHEQSVSACSGGVEDTLSEEVQLGSSIHLAFEELQARHVPLRGPIAVGELEGRVHGRILLESRGEAFQVG